MFRVSKSVCAAVCSLVLGIAPSAWAVPVALLEVEITHAGNTTFAEVEWAPGGELVLDAVEGRDAGLAMTSQQRPFGTYTIEVMAGTMTGTPDTLPATSSESDDSATRSASHIGFGNFVNSVTADDVGDSLSASIRQAVYGDLNGDGDVNISIPNPVSPFIPFPGDGNILISNLFDRTGLDGHVQGEKEWTDGDFDGDGVVTVIPPTLSLSSSPHQAI